MTHTTHWSRPVQHLGPVDGCPRCRSEPERGLGAPNTPPDVSLGADQETKPTEGETT